MAVIRGSGRIMTGGIQTALWAQAEIFTIIAFKHPFSGLGAKAAGNTLLLYGSASSRKQDRHEFKTELGPLLLLSQRNL